MTRASHTSITIPVERHVQLVTLAATSGARTMSTLLGRLVTAYLGSPPDLPGVEITRLGGDRLLLRVGSNQPHAFSFEDARRLARTIRDLASGERTSAIIDHNAGWDVRRKGGGVLVTVPLEGGAGKSYSPDLAGELADRLEGATL